MTKAIKEVIKNISEHPEKWQFDYGRFESKDYIRIERRKGRFFVNEYKTSFIESYFISKAIRNHELNKILKRLQVE